MLPTPVAAPRAAARWRETARDPTAPSPLLRELLRPSKTQSKAPPPPELLVLQIKGRIIGGRRPNSALLQISLDAPHDAALKQYGQSTYLVQEGSELRVPAGHSTTQTIRVLAVTADEVRVEIAEPSGHVLTLN
jgi:sRNA-binding protein